jgi:hypothetical protein
MQNIQNMLYNDPNAILEISQAQVPEAEGYLWVGLHDGNGKNIVCVEQPTLPEALDALEAAYTVHLAK